MATTGSGVNRPTNSKQKEEDVNRKLQVYGIISAFQQGKVPSNEQIDIALNSFLKSKPIANPSKQLSSEGQALVGDFRDIVQQAQHLLLSKNEGNLLQDFIWQSQHIDGGSAAKPGVPVGKDEAKQHGNEALDGLRTLGTLLISNGQFRKLLNDAVVLLRDIGADAATNAAGKVRPDEEQLKRIDEPAEDNTWHENPDFSKENLKKQAQEKFNKNKPIDRQDLEDARAHGEQQGDRKAGALEGAEVLKDRAKDGISEDKKDKARETRAKTKNYLDKKMPEERREQTIWRLKKIVVEVQSHSDYQDAINTLLNLAETYAGHASNLGQQTTQAAQGAHTDNSLKTAEANLKTLIERFANGTSTDDFFESLNAIYQDADKDPELKKFFRDLNAYLRKVLKQEGYILEDRSTEEWNDIYDRGNFLLRDRYRNHTDRIVDEIKFLADQFDQDVQNKKFAQSINKLFQDLGNDENGKPTFKPHLLKDLSEVILPGLFRDVQYVPIPRIEYQDSQFDAVIENLVVESDNLMPNIFEISNDNYFRWGRKKIANKNANSVQVSVSGIQCDLKDVAYHIKKKQGFPSITDTGVADIYLGGSGFSFKMKLSTADAKDRQNYFKVDKVDVDVKNFKIKLQKSKYKLPFAIFKPLMLKVIRPALQKALEKVIKDKVNELDGIFYQIKKEVDRTEQHIKENPEDAPNVYSRYVNAAKKNFMQGKKKAEDVAADKKVNMAVTKEDSIFPNIHLPGGISSKATEYKELARKGDKWESPIFKIGSASRSSNIPRAPEIRRKQHNVTQGGVRGQQNVGNTGSLTNEAAQYGDNSQARNYGSEGQGYASGGNYGSSNIGTGHTSDYATGNQSGNHSSGHPLESNTNGGYTNGNTNGATNGNFKQQVDQALNGNTTLGSNNPVLTGRY